jgi:hypothetical protein
MTSNNVKLDLYRLFDFEYKTEGTPDGGVRYSISATDGMGVQKTLSFKMSFEYPIGRFPEIDEVLALRLVSLFMRLLGGD